MSNKFAVGDVVALKCGSPKMVVVKVRDPKEYDDLSIECYWFHRQSGNVSNCTFPSESLIKVEPEVSDIID